MLHHSLVVLGGLIVAISFRCFIWTGLLISISSGIRSVGSFLLCPAATLLWIMMLVFIVHLQILVLAPQVFSGLLLTCRWLIDIFCLGVLLIYLLDVFIITAFLHLLLPLLLLQSLLFLLFLHLLHLLILFILLILLLLRNLVMLLLPLLPLLPFLPFLPVLSFLRLLCLYNLSLVLPLPWLSPPLFHFFLLSLFFLVVHLLFLQLVSLLHLGVVLLLQLLSLFSLSLGDVLV